MGLLVGTSNPIDNYGLRSGPKIVLCDFFSLALNDHMS
jgi:hypothetical protein